VPVVERDEYGEVIDEKHFQISLDEEEMRDAAVGGHNSSKGQGDAEMADMLEELEVDDRPTKVVSLSMSLQVRAAVMFLDFEGKSDGYSMKMIIGNVGPRELAVVSGSSEAVVAFTRGVRSDGSQKVYTPGNLEYVSISSAAVSSLSMKMSDDLLSVIQLQKIGNYSVAWVQGKMERREAESGGEELILAPVEKKMRTQGTGAAFVGDFRLGDLRRKLVSKGIKTELVQGVLICDDLISIQRVGAENEIAIQGPLSPKYYQVRSILNSQFQICN